MTKYLTIFFVFVFASSSNGFGQSIVTEAPSRLRQIIENFEQDRGAFNRWYSAETSEARRERFRRLYSDRLADLQRLDFARLEYHEQVDYILFQNHLRRELAELDRSLEQFNEMLMIVQFAQVISDLEDQRRRLETIDAEKTAETLDALAAKIRDTQRSFENGTYAKPKQTVAYRAVRTLQSLRTTLRNWYNFHNGYDPTFSWWNKKPYEAADQALQRYTEFVSNRLVGISPDDRTTIIGDPIGREALIRELEYEMIPYSPEELVEIANKEFEWCVAEFKKASREMGFGDDYMKAIEAVKRKYVEPGKQPALIRDQAREAIEYVKKNDLVTVTPEMEETWRMEMMSPERQLVAPFFLGGETIIVAYPTDTMTHEQKMMSLRGNNPHFARAVTHHELIPGHHMQQFMNRRYRTYRGPFRTPFWGEGWALYWEFILWDRGFVKTPEDKIGALFWRSHRAARIIFSLNFHLGKWTPQECVDLLVNKVGHERENALAEVRRSFSGDYGPLYQMAYMMGGLQFYQLHKDLVGSKKMTDRQFHDAILKEGSIPVEMVRAILTKQPLTRDFKTNWRFYPVGK
ncbi:DUF885 family protein [Leptolyngbya sp. 7M]|uniref:DUF885 family protein n=1 Tax=Leptolyngbya sp. 7M TaxID=2812896 RepID=UPI001B8AD605|nr:DUF885 family protein [Leptolyngbya sp. 7M]QYO66747.1 DUF885 domain-containing protein [Leptolyngbya sp. 7M]